MNVYPYLAAALLGRLEVAAFECVWPIAKLNRVPALCDLEARKADVATFLMERVAQYNYIVNV